MEIGSALERDIPTLEGLLESFSALTGVASALIDLEGVVLVGARWQWACTDFHRASPRSAARCLESDTALALEMTAGAETAVYRCRNGLTDAAAPVVVDGQHVANAFVGQFLLEPPDLDWFREQARSHGYDEEAYVRAICDVPVVPEAELPAMLAFLTTAARVTTHLALSHAREHAALNAALGEARSAMAVRERIATLFATVSDDRLYDGLLDLALDLTRSEHGVAGYVDESGDLVAPSVSPRSGSEREASGGAVVLPRAAWGEGLWCRALREGRTFWANEPSEAPVGPRPVSRTIAAPVVHQGTVVGLLQVGNRATDYSAEDVAALELVARHVGPLLHARLARERAEAEQRAQWARFLAMMDSFPEVMYVSDPGTYEVIWVNQVFSDALGRDPVGGQCYREFRGLDAPCSFCSNEVILSSPGTHTWDHWNPLTERHYLIRDQIIQWPDGRRVRFEVATDITERKEAELALAAQREELARSNRELEQFAYVASHDLQEPLRAISGFARLLERRYAGRLDESADDYIQFITDGADRLGQMIRDLLTFSRVNTRGQAFEAVDTEALLTGVLRDLAPAVAEAGATVTRESLPPVVADAGQLRQVFQNLIANAVRFRGEAPARIHVSGEELPEAWRFTVSDNGIGLDPAHAERIFVIFQRLEARDKYPGTGIGLAICKRVVERHGGEIGVDSRPGEGARFWFTLAKREGG